MSKTVKLPAFNPKKFKDMPEPEKWDGIDITNSWEDIYGVFREYCEIEPTREQIIEAFEKSNTMSGAGIEYGMSGYWVALQDSCLGVIKK